MVDTREQERAKRERKQQYSPYRTDKRIAYIVRREQAEAATAAADQPLSSILNRFRGPSWPN